MSPEEQADDAAALVTALGTGPAAVFGTSSGGSFALCLLARYPAAVRAAILHEAPLFALVDDLDAVRAPLLAPVRPAMETGGAPAATEPWWRYVAGDDSWTKLEPALRERMRASAHTLFEIELGTYERYLPDDETLAAIAPRVRLLISTEAFRLTRRSPASSVSGSAVNIHYTPGTHAAYSRPST